MHTTKQTCVDNEVLITNSLSLYTELVCEEGTHYHKATETIGHIDRTFIMCPTCLLATISSSSSLLDEPTSLHQRGISDHAPVMSSLCMNKSSCNYSQPIPNIITKDPLFKKLHSSYCKAAGLSELPDIVRWQQRKEIIREVACIVRKQRMAEELVETRHQ